MKSLAGPLSTWPCLGCLSDTRAYSTYVTSTRVSFLYPCAASVRRDEGEQEQEKEMKVRICIHSDINNDEESKEVEQRGTKLRAFLVLQHLCRHNVRSMSCVCVCSHAVANIHTQNRVRDFERWEKWQWERDERERAGSRGRDERGVRGCICLWC